MTAPDLTPAPVKRPRNSVHWKAVARAAEKLAADRLRDLEAERDRIDTLSTALGDALEEKGKIEVSAWLWERAAIIEGILLLAALGWMVWR